MNMLTIIFSAVVIAIALTFGPSITGLAAAILAPLLVAAVALWKDHA